jgi:hypothetical protein
MEIHEYAIFISGDFAGGGGAAVGICGVGAGGGK